MGDLGRYWGPEITKTVERVKKVVDLKWLAAALLLGLLPSIGLYIYYYYKKQPPLFPELKEQLAQKLAELPEVELKVGDIGDVGEEKIEKGGLKVLSGNVIGIWEQGKGEGNDLALTPSPNAPLNPNPPTLAAIRILGEVENVGGETVTEAKPIVRFYGKSKGEAAGLGEIERSSEEEEGLTLTPSPNAPLNLNLQTSPRLLATKVGQWNEGYKFLPLAPGEINVYDLVVREPPESETVTIEIRAGSAEENPSGLESSTRRVGESAEPAPLKIKQKNLESAEVQQGQQKLAYYKFSGTLVNTGEQELINPGIYVWLKNDQNKVIGLSSKTFENDLLAPKQELEVKILIIPVSTDQVWEDKIKTYGKKI